MQNKGLTVTIVFQANSLNYGEGFGNLSELKKIRRGSGEVFTFASRQSLRYSIVKQAAEQFGWKLAEVDSVKGTVQFADSDKKDDIPKIEKSEEIDLFGYMSTIKGKGKKAADTSEGSGDGGSKTRNAVVRLSPAISLEPFFDDNEFLTNKWLADRAQTHPNLANKEIHNCLYKYSITIDLDRIGVDEESKTELPPEERYKRVTEFLEVIKCLYRDIMGRRENLSPLFIIGGVYNCKNPFFMDSINISWEKNGNSTKKAKLNVETLKDKLDSTYRFRNNGTLESALIKDSTYIGIKTGFWSNEENLLELSDNKKLPPEQMIDKLIEDVKKYYGIKG